MPKKEWLSENEERKLALKEKNFIVAVEDSNGKWMANIFLMTEEVRNRKENSLHKAFLDEKIKNFSIAESLIQPQQ